MVFTETDGAGQMPKYRRESSEVGEKVKEGGREISWSLNFITNVWNGSNLWMWPFSMVQAGERCGASVDALGFDYTDRVLIWTWRSEGETCTSDEVPVQVEAKEMKILWESKKSLPHLLNS